MARFPRQRRLPLYGLLALVIVALAGSASSQTAATGSDFRISAGTSVRFDGQGPSVFGDTIGLDFRSGILRAAWADNSSSAAFDLATAAIAVASDGSASVGPTVIIRAAEDQTNASLAIDPSAAGRVLAVARTGSLSSASTAGVLSARSADGGSTWATTTNPVGVPDSEVGPDLACDGFGNCFLAYLSASDPFNPQLRLALSTNGGQSFSPVALPDLPGLEGDVSVAAAAGSVWLATTHFDTAPRLITLAAPVTGLGAIGTFSRQDVPRTGSGNKPDIAVGPGGKALVVTQHLSNGTLSFVEASTDPDGLGPAGFQAPVRVATGGVYPFQPMPQAAWDRARDRVYVVYRGDQLLSGEHGAGAVLLRSSTDSGRTWSGALRVNADVSSEDRLVPNVAVDSATGNVGVAWYDFRAGHGMAQLFGRVVTAAEPVPPPPPPTAPPSAPTNLTAAAVGADRVDLDWGPADDPDGYEIQRSTDGVSWVSLGRRFDTATEATVLGLQPETTYFFRVRAFNSGGDGPFSNVASARTGTALPAAPVGLRATALSRTRIDLSWTDTSTNEARFELERSTSGQPFQLVASLPANSVFFADGGLRGRTTYTYRVRACNVFGCSAFSNHASATTPKR
jgi:Fibronectin type III domain